MRLLDRLKRTLPTRCANCSSKLARLGVDLCRDCRRDRMRSRLRRAIEDAGRSALLALALVCLPWSAHGQPVGNDVVLTPRGDLFTNVVVVGPAPKPSTVEVELWRSDEGPPVELTERVSEATVWPDSFRLARGEQQLVRVALPRGVTSPGTLLRLKTRVTPSFGPGEDAGSGTRIRVRLRTTYVTKLWVGERP